jgi:hypothetical protein
MILCITVTVLYPPDKTAGRQRPFLHAPDRLIKFSNQCQASWIDERVLTEREQITIVSKQITLFSGRHGSSKIERMVLELR